MLEWIHNPRARKLRVSRKLIMKKAKHFATLKAEASGNVSDFNATWGEVQNLKKDPEFKNLCFVESTANGRMNEQTTVEWIKKVLKMFTFGTRWVLVWDT